VPIADVIAGPYSLPWGSSIFAIVAAFNNYGDSFTSDPGNGAVIITLPDAPSNIVDNQPLRTATSLTISWTAPYSNGGSPILSYQLSYD
jgi:hypothetical protein